jgi:Na+-transporting NADH:ubiquinone oxidoreductase subunit NqrB
MQIFKSYFYKLGQINQIYFQMFFLVTVLLYVTFILKLPQIESWYVITVFIFMQLFQFYFSWFFKITYNWKSSFTAGIPILFLMSTQHLQAAIFVTFVTVASKFIIRFNNKHIFNPNNFGIVLTIFTFPGLAAVTPYQWGFDSSLLAVFIFIVGLFITYSVKRTDMAFFFLIPYTFSILLFSYLDLFSGNIFHHLISVPIILFSFFMITDPKTIPDARIGRFIFAIILVSISSFLYIYTNLKPAFFFALPLASIFSPIIDFYFKSPKFEWKSS